MIAGIGSTRRFLGAWALVPALALGACATTPVAFSPQFSGQETHSSSTWQSSSRDRRIAREKGMPTVCRVYIGELRDTRDNTEDMGNLAYRPMHAVDTGAWMQSAFQSLNWDHRLTFVKKQDDSDIALHGELLKAYVRSGAGTGKAANVVMRIHFTRPGATDEDDLYRGLDTGTNWASGEEEMQGAVNRAMEQLLDQVDLFLAAHCPQTQPVSAKS